MANPAPVIAEGMFSYSIGGSERMAATLALEFRKRGYRSLCFAFYGQTGPIRDFLESQGVPCFDLSYTARTRGIRRLTYQFALHRFLREHQVHALHVHHCTSLIPCGLAPKLAGTRVVLTEHDLAELEKRPSYRRSSARHCRLADEVTVVHEEMTEFFRNALHVPAHRLHFVANGMHSAARDEATGAELRRQFGIAPDRFVFMFAGRLSPVKDLGTLLRAASMVAPQWRDRMFLLIVGDGSERQMLESLAASLGLGERLLFAGQRNDVERLLNCADAFVMTSVTEGMPLALLEAMSASVPCIATAVGGIPRLLDGGRGLVVPPRDPAAVAAAMERLMSDSDLRASLIRNGSAYVRANHDIDAVVDRYLSLMRLPPRWPGADGGEQAS